VPIRDIAAMNASLDNDYGATHGPNVPASHELALFDLDPSAIDDTTGTYIATELTGYGRATITNDATWAAAADGQKQTVAPVQMPDVAGEQDEATFWGLFDGTTLWDYGPLTEAVEVTEAGPGPQVIPVIFYSDSLDDEV
jgi:hypothetical protein